ncbi:MAG: CUAEP/CCAEP-tail radical SAM protein [Anaerolineales bacterium]
MAPVLLISCYELGHQPLGVAWPLAALRAAGIAAGVVDLAVEGLDEAAVRAARLVGIAVPMHTALRLGVEAARRVRAVNPTAHICFFGLYAWLNRDYLLGRWADSVIGGEAEAPLARLAAAVLADEAADGLPGVTTAQAKGAAFVRTATLPVPERAGLPGLAAYARYQDGGEPKLAGYVEATRGCQHLCRHCPIVPVYNGRLVVVPVETVLADTRQQVAAGAAHIVFGDPDFLNGPAHALRVARALHTEFPQVTFEFTAKVEHLLERRGLFADFGRLGCTRVTTAVESLSPLVLERLGKGHTAADVEAALAILDEAGIAMAPTLVAFTPWTTREDYLEVVEFIEARGLQASIAPVQLSIRLLVPPHSALIETPDATEWLGELDAPNFTYRWRHPDAGMDALWVEVSNVVTEAEARGEAAEATHGRIRALAYAAVGRALPAPKLVRERRQVPQMSEDWFC